MSRWVDRAEARRLVDIGDSTLHGLARSGRVRWIERDGRKRYLERDLVLWFARRRLRSRL
jgi:hypothetical protein